MSISVTGVAEAVLNQLGIEWPDVDEDQLRSTASGLTALSEQVGSTRAECDAAAGALVSANHGDSIDAFSTYWNNFSTQNFEGVREKLEQAGQELEKLADSVSGAKHSLLSTIEKVAKDLTSVSGLLSAADNGLAEIKQALTEIIDELGRIGWGVFAVVVDALQGYDYLPVSWDKYKADGYQAHDDPEKDQENADDAADDLMESGDEE
jgi:uncharacterized protein YukE